MQIIAVDIDGTIAQTTRRLVPYLGKEIIQNYNPFASTKDEMEFFKKHQYIFSELRPYVHAATVLWALKRHGWDVIYLTSRSPSLKYITQRWLLKNRFPPGKLVFSHNKLVVLKQLKAWALIEDAPQHIETAASITKVFIKDQPYNRHISGIRFKRWPEILLLIKEKNN